MQDILARALVKQSRREAPASSTLRSGHPLDVPRLNLLRVRVRCHAKTRLERTSPVAPVSRNRALELGPLLRARLGCGNSSAIAPRNTGWPDSSRRATGALPGPCIVRRAKADRVGTAIADLTICGAAQRSSRRQTRGHAADEPEFWRIRLLAA